jgi:hypothetical protein
MADFSGIMSLFEKQKADLPPWVEMTGPVGGQAFTTLTNPMTGETFTAGSTNYRVKPEFMKEGYSDYGHLPGREPGIAKLNPMGGMTLQPMKFLPNPEMDLRDMSNAAMRPVPMGGKNDGIGMGPMPDFGKALQPIGEGIKSMDQKLGNIEQKIGQQSPMQQQQTQLGMYGMPSFTAPNPYASSAFGNSLFGGIAPFLMNRYY